MTKPIYDSDGLCVTPTTYTTRAGEMPRDGLTVEVTVVGGEWLLSERDAARLHTALGEWLEKANLRRWPACESPMSKTVPGWSTLGEIGDAIVDRVVERLASREDQAHPEVVAAIAAKESLRREVGDLRARVERLERPVTINLGATPRTGTGGGTLVSFVPADEVRAAAIKARVDAEGRLWLGLSVNGRDVSEAELPADMAELVAAKANCKRESLLNRQAADLADARAESERLGSALAGAQHQRDRALSALASIQDELLRSQQAIADAWAQRDEAIACGYCATCGRGWERGSARPDR